MKNTALRLVPLLVVAALLSAPARGASCAPGKKPQGVPSSDSEQIRLLRAEMTVLRTRLVVEGSFLALERRRLWEEIGRLNWALADLGRCETEASQLLAQCGRCTPLPGDDLGPVGTLAALKEAVLEGDLHTLHSLLPGSWQGDLQDLGEDLIAGVDPAVYDGAWRSLSNLAIGFLEHRKTLSVTLPVPVDDVAFLLDEVRGLGAFAEIAEYTNVRCLRLDELLFDHGLAMGQALWRVLGRFSPDEVTQARHLLESIKIIDGRVDGEVAWVILGLNDIQEEVELRRVEGRWVPLELLEAWPATASAGREALEGFQKTLRRYVKREKINEIEEAAALFTRTGEFDDLLPLLWVLTRW
ncbi:MAG: hypothetical protein ABIK09_05765 [Pseudomonadota bacterium]